MRDGGMSIRPCRWSLTGTRCFWSRANTGAALEMDIASSPYLRKTPRLCGALGVIFQLCRTRACSPAEDHQRPNAAQRVRVVLVLVSTVKWPNIGRKDTTTREASQA